MTSPSTLASSPSDFKASSPMDIWHLCLQAPQDYAQEKLPKLKSATSTSYYDLDTDHKIPFYGTQEPEEYLDWERLMDDYLKLHQVPPEDQVKCATMNFHDYVLTRCLKTKRAMCLHGTTSTPIGEHHPRIPVHRCILQGNEECFARSRRG